MLEKQLNENFGKKVRTERERSGISLRKLASLLEMSPSYLSKLERGLVAPPSDKFIEQISEILDIDKDSLMASAGKVSSDVVSKIIKNPEIAERIRTNSY